MKASRLLLACVAGAALAAGCGNSPPPKTAANTTVTRPLPIVATTAKPPPTVSSQVAVSGEIARLCDIKAPPPTPSAAKPVPHFAFDSSQLNDDDRSLLSQVAKCFTSGPLKGHDMKLTGRADSRGEEEYNMTLGASRSGSVSGYLGSLGVASNQMDATSRGELDATGTDDAGYARDRRVDIDLQN